MGWLDQVKVKWDKARERIAEALAVAHPNNGALKQIGAMVVAEAQLAFRTQKWGGKAWKPRSVPNVMGIIADFYEGKAEPPKRRFEPRPALKDTGRLANTLAWRVKSSQTVEIGSNLPYAAAHQFGKQVTSKPITANVQQLLAEWLKKKANAKYRSKLGWLLNEKYRDQKLVRNMPKRQFLGLTKQLREDIAEITGIRVTEIINGRRQ